MNACALPCALGYIASESQNLQLLSAEESALANDL